MNCKTSRNDVFPWKFKVQQPELNCTPAIQPNKVDQLEFIIDFLEEGTGKEIYYDQLFDTKKVLGCVFQCEIVNRIEELCESTLRSNSKVNISEALPPWTILAKENHDPGYNEQYCMKCKPNVGETVLKKFTIIQIAGLPEDIGEYQQLEIA